MVIFVAGQELNYNIPYAISKIRVAIKSYVKEDCLNL